MKQHATFQISMSPNVFLCRSGGKPVICLDSILLQAFQAFCSVNRHNILEQSTRPGQTLHYNQVWCSRNIHILSFKKNQEEYGFWEGIKKKKRNSKIKVNWNIWNGKSLPYFFLLKLSGCYKLSRWVNSGDLLLTEQNKFSLSLSA